MLDTMTHPTPTLSFAWSNVFTTHPHAGNPLAIVHLSSNTLTQDQKQTIAREFNLSETVFLQPPSPSSNDDPKNTVRRLDIFTPFEELPLAGHPVIGTACHIATHDPALETATLRTKAGDVTVAFSRGADDVEAEALMPQTLHEHAKGLLSRELPTLQPGLGEVQPRTGTAWPAVSPTKGVTFVLVELPSFETLGRVSASRGRLQVTLDEGWTPSFVGYYFYYREGDTKSSANGKPREVRLHTRMVEADIGEDPVTGIAACTLAGYLAMEAHRDDGTREVECEIVQGEHMGRAGSPRVNVRVGEDGGLESTKLRGKAVDIMRGTLY